MELLPGISAVGEGIFIKKAGALVISDLHIGVEDALKEKGVIIPRTNYKELLAKINDLIERTDPKIIVLNGDIKHEFGRISRQEWKEVSDLLSMLRKEHEVIVVLGNHDNMLFPILRKEGIKTVDKWETENIAVVHGDEIVKTKAKMIIAGHTHPCIVLKEQSREEKYKCFVVTKNVILQPSIGPMTSGINVLENNNISPLIKSPLSKARILVPDNAGILDFGDVSVLRKKMKGPLTLLEKMVSFSE